MSKKPSAQRAKINAAPVKHAPHHDWLAPVSGTAPCGPDLEYDHDFVVLFASAAPKQDVQYGAFVGSPEPANWSDIERDCQRLMVRTKDVRVAVLYTRCRTRLAGAAGLAQGIELIAAWLGAFADDIHPQLGADNERDAVLEMRMNALQALADPEGLLADVRDIVLTKSTMTRLQVRDVERAFSHPRPADALAPESVAQQLQELSARQAAVMASFREAGADLERIDAWCAEHLDAYRPNFAPLAGLLRLLRQDAPNGAAARDAVPIAARDDDGAEPAPPVTDELSQPSLGSMRDQAPGHESPGHESPGHESPRLRGLPPEPPRPSAAPVDRETALASIRSARRWFETNEPSSPIPVLLKRAEQFVGKRYAQVVRAIPAELLAQWEETDSA
ncbi:ImpA family type VI secretion system protein [Trinickia sp.]|uniref:type VI secretion system protein TssA n=1 Tax=Trinickia sp. TaxID=2571163 RepID=UPI003F811733